MLLGDFNLFPKGYGKGNARIEIQQKDNSSIIFWKSSKIVGLLPESLKGLIPPHPKTGNTHSAFYFYSRNLPLFTDLH